MLLVGTLSHANWRSGYELPGEANVLMGDLERRTLRYEDTFATVAREEGVGYDALMRANPGIDIWLPGAGTTIDLPTAFIVPDVERKGMVINLSEMRLYYFDGDRQRLFVYPVGIGRQGYETPLGVTRTVTRIENPTWTPPESIRREREAQGRPLPRVVPPGPDNPLGAYAIKLAVPGYLIHGTNRPIGVGQRTSHGCIRLFPDQIEALIDHVPNGTVVNIIRRPNKAGWRDGALYLEAHPDEAGALFTDMVKQVIRATAAPAEVEVDWDLAMEVTRAARGIPVRISR